MKARVAILTLDKIDCETKTVSGDKEGHYIIIKGTNQQENITIVNIYVPNMKQLFIEIREEITINTMIVGDSPLTSMDKSSKQKINKETMDLN